MMKHNSNKFKIVRRACIVVLAMIAAGCGGGGGGGDQQNAGTEPPPVFTLSGLIQAPDNALIDSDVNDPNASYAPNDSFIEAQELPNPVILGGYVNLAGAGPAGSSQSSGDVSDFFHVSLIAGQSITLFIASDPAVVDLDLYLYDELENLADAAMGTGSRESLNVPADGDYFIEVRAVASDRDLASASNYNLTIGQSTAADLTETLRLSDEFVAGEVIVRFEDDAVSADTRRSLNDRKQVLGLQIKSGTSGRAMLLQLEDDSDRQQAFRALGIGQTESTLPAYQSAGSNFQHKADTLHIIKALRRRTDVRYAQPNYIRNSLAIPDDPQYPRQWHYPLINLPQSWDVTTGSNTVIVAVVDTGVLLNHPDLASRLTSDGYDFIRDPARALDGDGIDDNPDDPGDGGPGGSSFHGTHVSGTIGAATDNSLGVSGVTWSTRIMPLRALGQSGIGTDYDILQAVRYAAGLDNDSGTLPVQKADIINLSLGGSSYSPASQAVFAAVRAEGVIVVAAAGNSASGTPVYPAAYDGVVSVSAVDLKKDLAWYSNFGATIDVAAPGGDTTADVNLDGFPDGVLSTCGDDSADTIKFVYCFFQGTSMATPHVAGVIALMKAIYPTLTPDQLDILLSDGSITEDLGPAGRDDQFGYGLIDAYSALVAVQNLANGEVLPLTLVVNPTVLNFGPQSTAALRIGMEGGGAGDNRMVGAVTADVPWLDISEDSVDTDKLGTYLVTVNRSPNGNDLIPGIYTATVTIDADNPAVTDVEVPVSMQVVAPIVGGNAGFHYVLLADADTLEVQAQDDVAFNVDANGYVYTFTDIPAGTYKIFAGTDSNNDFVLGDPGEAYGAYLTLDQPIAVTISGDRSDLDFNTNFDVNLTSRLDTGNASERPMLQRFKIRGLAR